MTEVNSQNIQVDAEAKATKTLRTTGQKTSNTARIGKYALRGISQRRDTLCETKDVPSLRLPSAKSNKFESVCSIGKAYSGI